MTRLRVPDIEYVDIFVGPERNRVVIDYVSWSREAERLHAARTTWGIADIPAPNYRELPSFVRTPADPTGREP